jgi:hypothetical protein
MSTLKEIIEQARAVGSPEDINLANTVDSFLTDADATVGIGTKLHELIDTGRLKEYAALKRLALANGGFAKHGTPISASLEEGERLHWKGVAMQELSTILKNPDIISGNIKYGTPEFIHVDEMVVALQRMQDDTSCSYKDCSTFVHAEHGTSHLEQALGKEGADKLLREMYAAQRLGKAAGQTQERAIIILFILGVVGLGLILLHAPIAGVVFGVCGIAGLLLLAKRKQWV